MTIKITTIKILEEKNRHLKQVSIIISDRTTHYQLDVGGLPLESHLQLMQQLLEEREGVLWQVAQTVNNQLTTKEVRQVCYNSPIAGGWTKDEFQEAHNENFGGRNAKLRRMKTLRDAIREEWPIV